jgi:exodeoxyribonuclease V alpha subunit
VSFSNITPDQQMALDLCADTATRLVGITGAAGTGKTTILGEAVTEAKDAKYTVALCAPTGRAAARIRESSGHYARTAHRLLGYGAPDPSDPNDVPIPKRDKKNPIPADFIYVDESSMLSEELFRSLVDAMRPGSAIRFFGDMNQLPPVNSISRFQYVLDKFPSVELTHNFRSGDGIIRASQNILKGLVPATNDQVSVLNIGHKLGLATLDEFIDEEFATDKAQVIVPTKVGVLGARMINKYMQQRLNKSNRALELEYVLEGDPPDKPTRYRLRPGDKIIWTHNDYNLNLFNGMIGRVVDFDDFVGDVVLDFYGRDVTVPPFLEKRAADGRGIFRYDPRKYIDLAYAITTHKSQGSEFQRVIMLLYRSRALSRQNFYTGLTRARKHVTIIAGPGGMRSAMEPAKIGVEE